MQTLWHFSFNNFEVDLQRWHSRHLCTQIFTLAPRRSPKNQSTLKRYENLPIDPPIQNCILNAEISLQEHILMLEILQI